MSDGVILVGSHSDQLVDQAVRDGYVSVTEPERYKAGQSKHLRTSALEMLVLFEKAYLDLEIRYPGTFDCSQLAREGLAELVGEGFESYQSAIIYAKSHPDNRAKLTLQYVRPIIRTVIYKLMKEIGLFSNLEKWCMTLGLPYSYHVRRCLAEGLYDLFQSGLDILSDCSSISDVFDLPFGKGTGGEYLKAWLTSLLSAEPDSNDSFAFDYLAFAAAEFCYLLEQSALRKAPIVSEFPRVPPRHREETAWSRYLDSAHSRADAFRLFRLTLRDLDGYFPEVHTIEDVLRLREDKRIKRFRKKISEFSQGLREGDIENLEEMTTAVTQANQVLKKLEPYRKVTKWITYLSLPVTIAEAIFYQVPILGSSLALVGAGSRIKIDYSKLKHDWVLFGRYQ